MPAKRAGARSAPKQSCAALPTWFQRVEQKEIALPSQCAEVGCGEGSFRLNDLMEVLTRCSLSALGGQRNFLRFKPLKPRWLCAGLLSRHTAGTCARCGRWLGAGIGPVSVVPKTIPPTHGRAARARPTRLTPAQTYCGGPGRATSARRPPAWAAAAGMGVAARHFFKIRGFRGFSSFRSFRF